MWISPQKMYINNTHGKYEISDFGRVLTILKAKSEYEGVYSCKHSGKNKTVFLNVTCKIFVKIYIFYFVNKNNLQSMKIGLHDFKYFHNKTILVKIGMYSETSYRDLQLLPFWGEAIRCKIWWFQKERRPRFAVRLSPYPMNYHQLNRYGRKMELI